MHRIALAIAAILLILGHWTATAWADGIVVDQVFARATPKGAKAGAVYMTISNHGTSADRLLAATTPVAGRAELHETITEGGVSKMRPVDGIEVAPAGQAILKPGGLHLMLLDLQGPLKQGGSFPLTLVFAKAGSVTVTVTIEKQGAMGTGSGGTMPGMNM